MTEPLLLAIDQGTTNTKVLITGSDSARRWSSTIATPIAYPRAGWVESDPIAIWMSVRDAVTMCLASAPAAPVAIGITNQRESVVAWDRSTGTPLGPMVSWQCGRSIEACRSLQRAGYGPLIERTTGLRLDPMFSATKMRWLLDSIADGPARAAAGEVCLGTVDTWLVWNLTAGMVFATDATNASRTLLMDLRTCEWSEEMLDLFGVDRACLPEIRPSADYFGDAQLVGDGRRPLAVPVHGVAGDSHAALIGHGALEPGNLKASFGTGTSVMTPVTERIDPGALSATVGWALGRGTIIPTYALEGNIYATGAALDWTANLLGVDVAALDRLASECASTDGVHLVPAFAGLGAPHWQPSARGTLWGLTRGAGRPEVARAAFESVAHQVCDVIDALPGTVAIDQVRADGGAVRSAYLATLVADLTGLPVRRSDEPEVASLGAIGLAATGFGLWDDLAEVARFATASTLFEPQQLGDQRAEQRSTWAEAVRHTVASAP